jgi:formamidopyrimidine-DNA glycosylase
MPELPEVETIACGLRRMLTGATVDRAVLHRADILRPLRDCPGGKRAAGAALRRLAGRTVRGVTRRGKYLLLDFGGPRLIIHLGMTGQVVVARGSAPRSDHTHLVLRLRDGREMRYRDPRRFGHACVALDGELPASLTVLGPEPLGLSDVALARVFKGSRRCLKPLLMDQHVIAGIGNIYADEILFRCRLNPLTHADALSPAQVRALSRAVRRVLTEAIRHNGTTIGDYVTGAGVPGGFQEFLRVYGRAGRPCRQCGTPIVRTVVAQRGTHFCPDCQKVSTR